MDQYTKDPNEPQDPWYLDPVTVTAIFTGMFFAIFILSFLFS